MWILETHALNDKEALDLSAKYLKTEIENITVKRASKKENSLFSLFAKTDKKPISYRVYPVKNKIPIEVVIKGFVASLLQKVGYKFNFVKVEQDEDNKFIVELSSFEAKYIIGKKGQTLDALQLLTNVLLRHYQNESPKVLLDIADYRKSRTDYLVNLSQNVLKKVLERKDDYTMMPLNPYERRIIHKELQDHELVKTISDGSGQHKRIRVCYLGDDKGTLRDKLAEEKQQLDNDHNDHIDAKVLEDNDHNDHIDAKVLEEDPEKPNEAIAKEYDAQIEQSVLSDNPETEYSAENDSKYNK